VSRLENLRRSISVPKSITMHAEPNATLEASFFEAKHMAVAMDHEVMLMFGNRSIAVKPTDTFEEVHKRFQQLVVNPAG
jgi:hypothetical protein